MGAAACGISHGGLCEMPHFARTLGFHQSVYAMQREAEMPGIIYDVFITGLELCERRPFLASDCISLRTPT